jgi:transketolase
MRVAQNVVDTLREKASLLRKESMILISRGGFGHPGGSLSIAEILACLYFYPVLRINPLNPTWEERDRFIMSKAHCCPPHYIALAERGFFPKKELLNYCCIDSILQGHPDMRKTPGIDMSGGSLGQGLSVSVGMAIGAKFLKKHFRIYCMIGDGEIQSGQIWEAAMAAAHYKLDNITGIMDYNKVEAKGSCHDIMGIEPVAKKWKDFGWETIEIDGHDIEQIMGAFHTATHINLFGKPTMIIAHTIKGRGVPWMENNSEWHTHAPNSKQLRKALADIKEYSKGECPWVWR